MHLFELTRVPVAVHTPSVPAWALGCFRRRSISYFTGEVDDTTEVLWLQSRGLCADFRRAPGTPKCDSLRALGERSPAELLLLARVEGGLARTRWDGQSMHWSDWVSFQTHGKWPEPGRLERVGHCLIEFAPSGAYVEDWRWQPSGTGALIGLSLVEEKDLESGAVLHRGGGLIVCGRHAAFVRGRAQQLPVAQPLPDFLQAHPGDATALSRAFSCDAAFGTTSPGRGDFCVTTSTLPWRVGQPLLNLEGFSYPTAEGEVLQYLEAEGRPLERRFLVDTLEQDFPGRDATEPSAGGRSWLERERAALLG
jgi:hypothetical protein